MSRFRDRASIGAAGVSGHVRTAIVSATTCARRAAHPELRLARFVIADPPAVRSLERRPCEVKSSRTGAVALDQAVPAVRHAETAIHPGGDLDPMRGAIVLRRGRGWRARRR